MVNVIGWVYVVVIAAVMVGVAAAVQARVPRSARGLMWGGVALLIVGQIWSMASPMIFALYRLTATSYQVVALVGGVVHLTAVVLLLLAIGRAARGDSPALGYPRQGFYPGQTPSQHSGQAQHPGQPPYSGQAPYSSGQQSGPAQQQGYPNPLSTQPGDGYGASGQPGGWSQGPQH